MLEMDGPEGLPGGGSDHPDPASRRDATGQFSTASGRRRYAKPALSSFGELRNVTLGGTPGGGDSGAPLTQNLRK
jgi:hypothetical protein